MGAANQDERLSVSQAAHELDLSEKTVRGLIRRKELPAFKLTPRKTVVRREDLDKYLATRPSAAVTSSGRGGG